MARVELKPEDERVDVWLEHEPTRWPCPNCGETLPVFDHAAERTWCLGGQRRLPPHRRISCCPRASRIPATRSPLLAPADKGVGRQLGTVVETEGGGPPVQRDEFVENPDHAPSRNRPADIDRQTFAIPLAVERLVQGFDTEAGVERV